MMPEPPLFVLWYDFAKWLLNKTEKFPKKVRFTFSNRIDNTALDVIEGIIEARYSRKKKDTLRRIDLNMEKLQVLLRMCRDLEFLDNKGYEFASRKINEAGKMVGGWRKQQEDKES
ncbi:MAG: diversity-generating retroelement protein Avd [Deltaproteobacteria bacterium]|nr:diversity-generating retroelement protein Avd [Deltaproteobacteria bacterium]